MLSQDAVLKLNQELAGTKVLSVYLNAEDNNPAERRAWRIRLGTMLRELQEGLVEGSAQDRQALRDAVALMHEALDQYNGLLPERGWVGFATTDRLQYAAPSPAPMPDLVRWEDGAHVAPYLRVLKQARPVTAIVADSRRARVFQYVHGDLNEEQVLRSDTAPADTATRGSSKRPSISSGVRGEARGDAARRSEEVFSQRMLREAVEALSVAAEAGHLLVVGGTSEAVSTLLRDIPERARARATEVQSLHTEMTPAELKEAIEAAASALSIRLQRALVQEVLDATRSAGRGCLGPEPTERAIQAGAVDTLILTRAFARTQPDIAERLVDSALDQGATVEEISEAASAELDRAGGIGARLRFAA